MCSLRMLTFPLKVRRRRHYSDALVHGPLADPKVVVEPLLQIWRVGESFWLDAGAVPSPGGERGNVSGIFFQQWDWGGALIWGMTRCEGEGIRVMHGCGTREGWIFYLERGGIISRVGEWRRVEDIREAGGAAHAC